MNAGPGAIGVGVGVDVAVGVGVAVRLAPDPAELVATAAEVLDDSAAGFAEPPQPDKDKDMVEAAKPSAASRIEVLVFTE